MFCKNCGEAIEDGSRFCRFCGAKQIDEPPISQDTAHTAAPVVSTPATGRSGKSVLAIIAGLVLLIIVVGALQNPSPTSSTVGDNVVADAGLDTLTDNMTAADAAPTANEAPTWSYSTDEDKVRGGTSYFAATTSTNTVRQDPPYDSDTSMRMTVRRMPSSGTDVVLTISSGQFMCPSYEGCSGTVRFDNAPAQRVRFNGPADNSSDTIFVVGAKNFVSKLKKAKRVIIEKTLYQAGEPQFEFDVAGLKWDH